MKQTLARINNWQFSRTGKFQVSGFGEVDQAVASMVSDIFSKVLLVAPQPYEARYASFLARSPADRVFVGRYDNIIEFLHALRRASAGQGRRPEAIKDQLNPDALPLVNISRSMDISYENNDQQIDRRKGGDTLFRNEQTGEPLAQFEYTQALLTYDVTLLATDKITLGLMANTLGAHFRQLMGSSFMATTKMMNAVDIPLNLNIEAPKEVGFTDVSAPLGEERVYAVQAPITVMSDVAAAWELESRRIRSEIDLSLYEGE